MRQILLLGAGKIGSCIVDLLTATGDYHVFVGDSDAEALARLLKAAAFPAYVSVICLDVSDPAALSHAMVGKAAVLSALPFYLNIGVAQAALHVGLHYFDLTEDVATTRAIKELAHKARCAFMPQCGLAPGFISIVANELAKRFEALRDVHMRVGALPIYPDNALKYNLTWSTDGLINEYLNPCEAIYEGKMQQVRPLEGLEHFSFDGIDYEAFNTSGGLGTLCESLNGKVERLDYKTVRYPGHRDLIWFLCTELRLGQRRELLKELLEQAVAITKQDVVLIYVSVIGWNGGRLLHEAYAKKIYHASLYERAWSAIQITTAAGITTMLDLLLEGALPQAGFICQEQVSLESFLQNRFGRYYA
jgi:saccharopine dehydrogenase-like NADP-dependent oxidoreductase